MHYMNLFNSQEDDTPLFTFVGVEKYDDLGEEAEAAVIEIDGKKQSIIFELRKIGPRKSRHIRIDAFEKSGLPVARVTSYSPEFGISLQDNQVLVKNYGENKGIINVLEGMKMISDKKEVRKDLFLCTLMDKWMEKVIDY
jgi:hypothetical protein